MKKQLILPLSTAHISAEEWDAFGQRALASIPRQYMPIVLGWVSSEATPQEWASVKQLVPRPVRILAQAFWVPPTPSAVVASTPSVTTPGTPLGPRQRPTPQPVPGGERCLQYRSAR